jgi:4-amino-4-deoxy-L-arabinose transferase-like glycosyltransferase
MRFKNLFPVVVLLILAAGLRVWQIDQVPPGLHHDEVINGEIVENDIFAGHPAIFYATGGREGLFHLTLAAALRWIGYSSIGFRFAGFFWGMIGLAAIYALANRLLGRRVAFVTLAFAAVSLWSIYEGRAATRSVSLIAVSALAAVAFFSAWQPAGRPRLRKWISAGALLGLTLYTYIAARVIPIVFLACLAYLALTRWRSVRAAWRGIAVYAAAAIVVMAPLVAYLSLRPAVDLRFQMLTETIDAARAGNFLPALTTTLQTLGMFVWQGDPQWHYNVAGTPVFDPATSVLFLLGLALAVWRVRRLPYAFYLIWLFVTLIPGMLSEPAPHYMRTAAAQVAAYTFVGIGSAAAIGWAERRSRAWERSAAIVIGLIWLGAAVVNYHNFFVVWPANDEVRFYHQANVNEMAKYLDARPGAAAPVVGCSPFLNEKEDWLRSPRQTIHFELRRTDLPIRWHDCRDSLVFPAGGQWQQFILYLMPPEQNLPPSITSWLANTQPALLNAFGDSLIYDMDARDRLAATLAEVEKAEAAWPEGNITTTLPVDFGHSVKLIGYQVKQSSLRPGKTLNVTTYWQVIGQPPPFLTVFLHLLDGSGQIAAQVDRQSVLADTLQPGDVFMQIHDIDLPASSPPGSYRLSIGLYSSETGQRLPLHADGAPRGDRLLLQPVTIVPPK